MPYRILSLPPVLAQLLNLIKRVDFFLVLSFALSLPLPLFLYSMRRRGSCHPPSLSPQKMHTRSHEVAVGHDETTSRTTSHVLKAWQASRQTTAVDDSSLPSAKTQSPSPTLFLRSGVPRKFTANNFRIAAFLLSQCWLDVAKIVLALHPIRMPLMILFTLIQGALPAYQTYSQAVIFDEVGHLFSCCLARFRPGRLVICFFIPYHWSDAKAHHVRSPMAEKEGVDATGAIARLGVV